MNDFNAIGKMTEDNEVEKMPYNKLFEKHLLERRKIFLWGMIDDKSSKNISDKLLYLDSKSAIEPITLFLNSPGGMVTSGMVIYDIMQIINAPVHTVCMGLSASMASILLSSGKKGERSIFPHGEVMIHQPSIGGVFQGTSVDIEIQAEQIKKTKTLGAKILAKNCNKSQEQIMKDFDRDYWMDADEAIQYGIVDKAVSNI